MNFYHKACFDFERDFIEFTYLFYQSIFPCFCNSDTSGWHSYGAMSWGKKGVGLDYLSVSLFIFEFTQFLLHVFARDIWVFTMEKLVTMNSSVVRILQSSPWQVLGSPGGEWVAEAVLEAGDHVDVSFSTGVITP